MLRRYAGVAVVLFLFVGFVAAETIRGTITKADDKEITVNVRKDKKDKEGENKTFKVSKDTKFAKAKGKGKDAEDATADDFKSAMEKAKKGLPASIEVEDGTATKITFMAGKGGKKKKDADK